MKREKVYHDFVIDRLTNSIVNTISGDSFQTTITILSENDFKQITKKNGWLFNWNVEWKQYDCEVYKLTIAENSAIIQRLISLLIKTDHVFISLLESAPFNRDKSKLYEGVAGNLVAFACKLSFQRGFEGYISFEAKTKLIEHYKRTLNAHHVGGNLMIIESSAAKILIDKYFKL